MHHKTQSIITVSILVLFMIAIGVLVNNMDSRITGATTAEDCDCSTDSDCGDSDPCTEDLCLYPDNCKASLCIHKSIENCG